MSDKTALFTAGGWLRVTATVLVVIGAPALFRSRDVSQRPFDVTPLRALQATHPDCILVGDSMLATRIDPTRLNEIADRRCAVLGYPGTASAVWYLIMENIIGRLLPPPRWTIIFFRDRQLTRPAMRTTGRCRERLEPFMLGQESAFQAQLEKATLRQSPLFERISRFLYPVQTYRYECSENLREHALKLVSHSAMKNLVRDATKDLFDLHNLRNNVAPASSVNNDENDGLNSEDVTFADSLNGSFLPMMLTIAERQHIRLLFFRVKRRPPDNAPFVEDGPGAQRYQHDLRTYLAKRGAILFDETREGDVSPGFYGEGDHVAQTMMRRYTDLFWQKIHALLSSTIDGAVPSVAP